MSREDEPDENSLKFNIPFFGSRKPLKRLKYGDENDESSEYNINRFLTVVGRAWLAQLPVSKLARKGNSMRLDLFRS